MKQICNCGQCTQEYQHSSDCAVHNEPAYPNGPCDCKPVAAVDVAIDYTKPLLLEMFPDNKPKHWALVDRISGKVLQQTRCCVPLIFLDIDGVFNCQLFYSSKQFKDYKEAKKQLRKDVKAKRIDRLDYYASQICKERIKWFSELCKEINAEVVVSSTWRSGKTVEELQEIFDYSGGDFKVISKTEHLGFERGIEISKWLKDNIKPETHGCHYFDFFKYAIIDDDSDMLLNQRFNFFQTDNYSGLTPNTCYKIKRFITGQTFGVLV